MDGLEESIKDVGYDIMIEGRNLRREKQKLNYIMQRKELVETEIMEIQARINKLQELPVKMRAEAEKRK